MAPGPPRTPHPSRPCRGNHGGRGGDGAGRTPPLPPTPLQAGEVGEGGNREEGSRGRRKSGLGRAGGFAERAERGLAAELGGEGFRNPVGAGPRVQMSGREGRDGGGGWAGLRQPLRLRLRPLRLGVVLGPGRGGVGGRLPESLALRGSRPSCEPNNRPRRPAAEGRGLCGPAPPSTSRSLFSLCGVPAPIPPPPGTTAFPLHVPSASAPPLQPGLSRPGFPSLPHLGL